MARPDRFERMVQEVEAPAGLVPVIMRHDAIKLLRQHHQDVVKLVRGNRITMSVCASTEHCKTHNRCVEDILTALKELTK